MHPSTRPLSRLHRSNLALVIAGLVVIAHALSNTWLLESWLDYRGHYSHGLLVVGMVGYLLWGARDRLIGAPLAGLQKYLVLAALLAASLAWFASATAGIKVASTLATLATVWFALAAVLGRGALWRLLPFFALLACTVPIWQPILNPPLQDMATRVVNELLRTLGLTLFMEGNSIVMPDITFEIVGGCSGLGYLFVAFTLAMYLALDSRLKPGSGVLLVLGFCALALLSNWIRIAVIMLIGYEYGPSHRLVSDHLWFGWVVFSVIFFPVIFLVVRRLPVPARTPIHPDPAIAAGSFMSRRSVAALLATVLLLPMLHGALALHARLTATEPVPIAPDSGHARPAPVPLDATPWEPVYPRATRTSVQAFAMTDDPAAPVVSLFQAFYARQSSAAEVIDSQNDLAGPGWSPVANGPAETVIGTLIRPVRQQELVDPAGRRMLVWSWYRIGDSHEATDLRAKIAQVLWKLRLRPDASVVALATECTARDCSDARRRLTAFAAALDTPT
jgi:EpsI family protein